MEIQRLVDQLNRSFSRNAWHGPAVMEILSDVSAKQAAARPIPNAHSIWEIVQHIASWNSIVERRLRGNTVNETTAEDWPPVRETSVPAWQKTQAALQQAHETLVQTILQMSDPQLETKAPGQDTSIYVMLHGLIQHDLYHAGQISLLKKF
ncbi:MAG TPA: DinB family protein [bacterium]